MSLQFKINQNNFPSCDLTSDVAKSYIEPSVIDSETGQNFGSSVATLSTSVDTATMIIGAKGRDNGGTDGVHYFHSEIQ